MKQVVVIGHGMVGARFVEELPLRDTRGRFAITALGAEEHEPYNRVLLSDFVAGKIAVAALPLPRTAHDESAAPCCPARRRSRSTATRGVVHDHAGERHRYDVLVLATGARARMPDLSAAAPTTTCRRVCTRCAPSTTPARSSPPPSTRTRAVVIGAGVLGLEAACGLASRGLPVDPGARRRASWSASSTDAPRPSAATGPAHVAGLRSGSALRGGVESATGG